MSMKALNKLLDAADSALVLFDIEGHIQWDPARKRWYCTSHCEWDQCPALNLEKLVHRLRKKIEALEKNKKG